MNKLKRLCTLLGFVCGGCIYGGTGPTLGFSNEGPTVGWEGSAGWGPVGALAGATVRPLAKRRWFSTYIAADAAVGVPLSDLLDPSAALTGGGSAGFHLTTGGERAGGGYLGAWGAVPFSIDDHTPCEPRLQRTKMASITVGMRVFLGGDRLWEAYISPKLGFMQDTGGCPDIHWRAQ